MDQDTFDKLKEMADKMREDKAKEKPCPNCGHCPTCGRSAAPYPYYPYWYYPYWEWRPCESPSWTISTTGTYPNTPSTTVIQTDWIGLSALNDALNTKP